MDVDNDAGGTANASQLQLTEAQITAVAVAVRELLLEQVRESFFPLPFFVLSFLSFISLPLSLSHSLALPHTNKKNKKTARLHLPLGRRPPRPPLFDVVVERLLPRGRLRRARRA